MTNTTSTRELVGLARETMAQIRDREERADRGSRDEQGVVAGAKHLASLAVNATRPQETASPRESITESRRLSDGLIRAGFLQEFIRG